MYIHAKVYYASSVGSGDSVHLRRGAQRLSCRVLDSRVEGLRVRASPAALCCVLENKFLFITGLTQEEQA